MLCLFAFWKTQPQMISDRVADLPQGRRGRHEVAPKMAARYREQRVEHPICYEQPGKKEMPTASHCQPLDAGQGHPVREGTDCGEGLIKIRDVAPVECWVGIEDLQPAHQQYRHADHIDPMR